MKVFFSYSHLDEPIRNQLEVHCAMLKRNGEIEAWHDRRILGGEVFDGVIKHELEQAGIILLLVSPHFLNSDYCFSVEMTRAIERGKNGSAHVLPIIAEECDWLSSPLSKLKALPSDGKPLSKHANVNDGYLEIVQEIRKIIGHRQERSKLPADAKQPDQVVIAPPVCRSSNLRLKKEFSAVERDKFLFASFEYIAAFFEESLNELGDRNPGVDSIFRRISANSFTTQVYRHGKLETQCQISLNNFMGRTHQIHYSSELRDNTFSESLRAEDDGQMLFLKPSFLQQGLGRGGDQLTQEGAAEYFWSMLIGKIQ